MLKACVAVLALSIATPVLAQSNNYVQGHLRSDGTYVQGHYRTNPDSSLYNNYSTRGNVNPYTGRVGTVDPYRQPSYNPYRSTTRRRGY